MSIAFLKMDPEKGEESPEPRVDRAGSTELSTVHVSHTKCRLAICFQPARTNDINQCELYFFTCTSFQMKVDTKWHNFVLVDGYHFRCDTTTILKFLFLSEHRGHNLASGMLPDQPDHPKGSKVLHSPHAGAVQ